MDIAIGAWVSRWTDAEPPAVRTKRHLVESDVAESVITRCGRRMAYRTSSGTLQVTSGAPETTCRRCLGDIG
jgi:hypothetical protein